MWSVYFYIINTYFRIINKIKKCYNRPQYQKMWKNAGLKFKSFVLLRGVWN